MCLDDGGHLRAPFLVENLLVLLPEREIVHIIGHIHLDLCTCARVFDSRVCVVYLSGRSSQVHLEEKTIYIC